MAIRSVRFVSSDLDDQTVDIIRKRLRGSAGKPLTASRPASHLVPMYGKWRTSQEGAMLAFETGAQTGARTARMEQRTTPETKALIERAASLQGVNASEFLLMHGASAARETIRRLEGTVIQKEDRDAFMKAFDDTEPTKDLVDLMALHRRITS